MHALIFTHIYRAYVLLLQKLHCNIFKKQHILFFDNEILNRAQGQLGARKILSGSSTLSFHSLSWDVSWMCNIYLIYDNSFLEVGFFFFSSSLPYLIYCHCFISGTFLAARKLLRCRPYSLVWFCVSGILLSGLSFYLLWEHVVVHTHISSGFPWENLDYKVFNCLQWNLWLSLY